MTWSELRAKEGYPGTRETVIVSPGIEMTLVFGDDRKVARIELPGVGPDGTRERVDEVLLDLVPMCVRGEKIGWGMREVGGRSHHTRYEHVMIVEREERSHNERSGVWVHFTPPH
jgi:hypothetical protein